MLNLCAAYVILYIHYYIQHLFIYFKLFQLVIDRTLILFVKPLSNKYDFNFASIELLIPLIPVQRIH